MNPYYGQRNATQNEAERDRVDERGVPLYWDPFSAQHGIHEDDAYHLHGRIVSRRHLFNYVHRLLGQGASVRFADGLYLYEKELKKIVYDPAYYEITTKSTIQTGTHAGAVVDDDDDDDEYINNMGEFLSHHQNDDAEVDNADAEWRQDVVNEMKATGMVVDTGKKARTYLQKKIAVNTREMKAGTLKGGAGNHPKVKSRAQMLAISYSEAGKHGHGGDHGHKAKSKK